MAPAQRVRGGLRGRVGEHRQDEPLGVPEGVAVVARAGQALGRDRALFGPGAWLQGVDEREGHRLLQLDVSLELDVGAAPELVEVRALVALQSVPTRVPRGGQSGHDLVAQRRLGAPARPAVREELDDAEPLSRRELGRDGEAADVRPALRGRLEPVRPLDDVVHARRHADLAVPRRVHEHGSRVAVEEALRDER